MATKGAGKAEEGEKPKRIKKSAVIDYIITYRDFIKRANNYCDTTLETLSVHPSSPVPDPFVRELSEEEVSGPRDRILTGWRGVEIEDEDMETHLEDFGNEVEDFGSEDSSLLGAAAPRQPNRLKRFFTTLNKRSRKSESKGAAEHAEVEKRKTVARRLSDFVNKEYDHLKKLKKDIGKALGTKELPSPQSSVPRTNTPVLEDPIASAIEDMVRDIHILQLGIRILESKLNAFEMDFKNMCSIYSPKAHGMMNDKCSKELFDEMQDMLRLKLTSDIMVNRVDSKLKKQSLFVECSEKYQKQLLAHQKTDERVKDMAAGGHSSKDETPQKIQRKRLTVDDTPKEMDPSPAKHAKKQESGASWEEPKVGKLVDIESPVKQYAEGEKLPYDEKSKGELEDSDEDSKDGLSNLMRKSSMEDLR